MKGIDISHYQNQAGKINWEKLKASEYKFCFVKCTEGNTYRDSFYTDNKDESRKAGLVFGAYHFARLNDPIQEADNFCDNVGDLKEGELVILDFEVDGHADPVGWCLKWLNKVEERTRVRPLLYTNEARVKSLNWKRVVDGNFGLWVAKYASQAIYVPEYLQRKPVSDEWPFWAIWQYSSRANVPGFVGNVDVNTTDMDVATLKKYGKQETVECLHCERHCPKH